MRIREVELFEVEAEAIAAVHRNRPLYNILLCRIRTDEGIDGIGELPFTRGVDPGAGLHVADGHFTVPTTPGLGVTLDMDVVRKYRVG